MIFQYKKKFSKVLILTLFLVSASGAKASNNNEQQIERDGFTYDVILSEDEFRTNVETEYPECKIFLGKKHAAFDLKSIEDCLLENRELTPTIVDKILDYNYLVSQEVLDEVLTVIVKSTFSTKHVKTIGKLINAGASTKNLNARIYDGNDIACGAVQLVLEENKNFYENNSLLNIRVNGLSRWLDLHFLTNTGMGRNLCSEVISMLVSFNKNLVNFQSEYDGSTTLHEYLYDIGHPDWNMEVAKLLMSEVNVNLQTNEGNTALHYLLFYNKERPEKIAEILKIALALGADLTLENKEGITAKSLILERIDLTPLFN